MSMSKRGGLPRSVSLLKPYLETILPEGGIGSREPLAK